MGAGSAQRAARRGGTIAAGAATALGIASAVFAESLIAGLVAIARPAVAFAVLTAVCTAGAAFIVMAFDGEAEGGLMGPLIARVQAWIGRHRTAAEAKFGALVSLSEGVAFAVLSVTAGPFVTTLAVKVRGTSRISPYLLSAASAALFSACWVAVYSGVLAALRLLIDGAI